MTHLAHVSSTKNHTRFYQSLPLMAPLCRKIHCVNDGTSRSQCDVHEARWSCPTVTTRSWWPGSTPRLDEPATRRIPT